MWIKSKWRWCSWWLLRKHCKLCCNTTNCCDRRCRLLHNVNTKENFMVVSNNFKTFKVKKENNNVIINFLNVSAVLFYLWGQTELVIENICHIIGYITAGYWSLLSSLGVHKLLILLDLLDWSHLEYFNSTTQLHTPSVLWEISTTLPQSLFSLKLLVQYWELELELPRHWNSGSSMWVLDGKDKHSLFGYVLRYSAFSYRAPHSTLQS